MGAILSGMVNLGAFFAPLKMDLARVAKAEPDKIFGFFCSVEGYLKVVGFL